MEVLGGSASANEELFELDFEQIPDTEVVCEKPSKRTTANKYVHELIQVSDSDDDDYCEVLSQHGGLDPVSDDDDCVVIDVVKRVNNSNKIIRDDNNCKISISNNVDGERVSANKDKIADAISNISPTQDLEKRINASDIADKRVLINESNVADKPVLSNADKICGAVFPKKSDNIFVDSAQTSHSLTSNGSDLFTNEENDRVQNSGEIHNNKTYSNDLEPVSDYENDEIIENYFLTTFNKYGSFIREKNHFSNDNLTDADKEISSINITCDAAGDESSDLEPGEIRDDEDENLNPILDANRNKTNELSIGNLCSAANVLKIPATASRETTSGNKNGTKENHSFNNNFEISKRDSFNIRGIDEYNSSNDCEMNQHDDIEEGEVLSNESFEKPTPIKPLNTNIRVSDVSNNCFVAKNVTESCGGPVSLQHNSLVKPIRISIDNSNNQLRTNFFSGSSNNSVSNATECLSNISNVEKRDIGPASYTAKNNKESGVNKEDNQCAEILASEVEIRKEAVYCNSPENIKNINGKDISNELNANKNINEKYVSNEDHSISIALEQMVPEINVIDEIANGVENASEGSNSVVISDGKIPFMKPTTDVITFIDITSSETLVVVKPVEKIAVPDSESDDDVCYLKPANEPKRERTRNRKGCATLGSSQDLRVKVDVKPGKSKKRIIEDCRMYADRLELDRELRMREKSKKRDENERGRRRPPDDWRTDRKRSRWDYRYDSPFNSERDYAREMRRHAREMSNHAREIRNHAREMSASASENRNRKRDRSRKRRSDSPVKSDRKSEIRDGVRKERESRRRRRETNDNVRENRETRETSSQVQEIVHEVYVERPETQHHRHEARSNSLDYCVRMTLRCERNVSVNGNGMPTITITPDSTPPSAQHNSVPRRCSNENRFQRAPNGKYPPGGAYHP